MDQVEDFFDHLERRFATLEKTLISRVGLPEGFSLSSLSKKFESISHQLMTLDWRTNDLEKKHDAACFKYDKIYLDNLYVPGLIGEHCDFANLKAYIEAENLKLSKLISSNEQHTTEISRLLQKTVDLKHKLEITVNSVERNFLNDTKKLIESSEYMFDQKIKMIHMSMENIAILNNKELFNQRQIVEAIEIDYSKVLKIKNDILEENRRAVEEMKTVVDEKNDKIIGIEENWRMLENKILKVEKKSEKLAKEIKLAQTKTVAKQDDKVADTNKKLAEELREFKRNFSTSKLLNKAKNSDLSLTQKSIYQASKLGKSQFREKSENSWDEEKTPIRSRSTKKKEIKKIHEKSLFEKKVKRKSLENGISPLILPKTKSKVEKPRVKINQQIERIYSQPKTMKRKEILTEKTIIKQELIPLVRRSVEKTKTEVLRNLLKIDYIEQLNFEKPLSRTNSKKSQKPITTLVDSFSSSQPPFLPIVQKTNSIVLLNKSKENIMQVVANEEYTIKENKKIQEEKLSDPSKSELSASTIRQANNILKSHSMVPFSRFEESDSESISEMQGKLQKKNTIQLDPIILTYFQGEIDKFAKFKRMFFSFIRRKEKKTKEALEQLKKELEAKIEKLKLQQRFKEEDRGKSKIVDLNKIDIVPLKDLGNKKAKFKMPQTVFLKGVVRPQSEKKMRIKHTNIETSFI